MFGYYFRLDSNCLDNVYAHVYLAHDQNITKHQKQGRQRESTKGQIICPKPQQKGSQTKHKVKYALIQPFPSYAETLRLYL
jgi:hypothetical protein